MIQAISTTDHSSPRSIVEDVFRGTTIFAPHTLYVTHNKHPAARQSLHKVLPDRPDAGQERKGKYVERLPSSICPVCKASRAHNSFDTRRAYPMDSGRRSFIVEVRAALAAPKRSDHAFIYSAQTLLRRATMSPRALY